MMKVRIGILLIVATALITCAVEQADVDPANWQSVVEQANGTTVNFYMWGGSASINAWVDDVVAPEVKQRYDVTVNRVPMDASVFVTKLVNEKQAGRKRGTIDLMWINGENFKNAREADVLYGPFADKLPNFTFVDPATVEYDFGYPVMNYEAPYGRAQFVFEYDSAKVANPPQTFAELLAWAKANPGRFTYPKPPDFTGSAFVRQVFYATTGGHEQYMAGFDGALFSNNVAAMLAYLTELEPHLWNEGTVYPQDIASVDTLFQRGEIDINMSYHQAHAQNQIIEGLYPETVRTFVLRDGSIYNTHFTAIAFNAPNIAGALVLADYLLSPDAQLSKNDPANWGDFTALDIARLSEEDRVRFENLDLGAATLPLATLSEYAVPEIPSAYLELIESAWSEEILPNN